MITGAGGSIGSELARIVARCEPAELVLMERAETALFEIDRQVARRAPSLPRRAILHDVVDVERTLDACRECRPEIVVHAAAHKHVPMMEDHPGAAVDNNLFGTKSIADAAHAAEAVRFVMISTDKAVNPVSVMGATKRLAELYVQDIGRRSETTFSIVRFGNVLGSSGSVIETWSRQIADGGPVTVTDRRMTRYFMTMPEAAALVLESALLADPAAGGEVFLLDMGEPVSILAMAERFIRLHGLEPVTADGARAHVLDVAPQRSCGVMPIVFTGARPGEKLREELAFDAECMQPTRHPDINIWLLPPPQPVSVEAFVRTLSPQRRSANPRELAAETLRLARSAPLQPVAA
jgi:FlaA1/EpsC-like NDP-sugar epimerase